MKVYVDDNEDYRITYSSRDGSECLESMGMQPIIVESLLPQLKIFILLFNDNMS